MDKIDTQGMSGPAIPGGSDNIYPRDADGNLIYPRAIIRPNRLHTPQMVKELKILINEVLDEREGKTGVSYFDTEHFKHYVGEEEPEYKPWSHSSPWTLDDFQE